MLGNLLRLIAEVHVFVCPGRLARNVQWPPLQKTKTLNSSCVIVLLFYSRYLLRHGADVMAANMHGQLPLHLALLRALRGDQHGERGSSVHGNPWTWRTFPMAPAQSPTRDLINFDRIYKAHWTIV